MHESYTQCERLTYSTFLQLCCTQRAGVILIGGLPWLDNNYPTCEAGVEKDEGFREPVVSHTHSTSGLHLFDVTYRLCHPGALTELDDLGLGSNQLTGGGVDGSKF